MMNVLTQSASRFLRTEERGAATVEFVIIFPVFILLFLSSFEAAMMLTRQVMLERGIDIAVRDLRLGTGTAITQAQLRTTICEEARVLPDCEANMLVELTVISQTTYDLPAASQPCVDRTGVITPVVSFSNGSINELMLIRACYVVDPMFPGSGLGLQLTRDTDGELRMIASAAFVNEPL